MIVLKGHQKNYCITPQAFHLGLVDQKSVSLFQGAQPGKAEIQLLRHHPLEMVIFHGIP